MAVPSFRALWLGFRCNDVRVSVLSARRSPIEIKPPSFAFRCDSRGAPIPAGAQVLKTRRLWGCEYTPFSNGTSFLVSSSEDTKGPADMIYGKSSSPAASRKPHLTSRLGLPVHGSRCKARRSLLRAPSQRAYAAGAYTPGMYRVLIASQQARFTSRTRCSRSGGRWRRRAKRSMYAHSRYAVSPPLRVLVC